MNWHEQIGKQHTFTARFIRAGHRQMLLRDVSCTDGTHFRDHLFLPYTKTFRRKKLRNGDTLTIRGKVNRYYKKDEGYEHMPRHPKFLIAQYEITNIKIITIERTTSATQ